MADVIRDVVVRISVQQQPINLKVPNIAPIKKAADGIGESFERAAARAGKPMTKLEKSLVAIEQKQNRVGRSARVTGGQMSTHFTKAGRALNLASSGAMHLARGLTLIGSHNKSIEKLVRNLALMQGIFDTFKGLRDVGRGIGALAGDGGRGGGAGGMVGDIATQAAGGGVQQKAGSMAKAGGRALKTGAGKVGLAVAAAVALTYFAKWVDDRQKEKERSDIEEKGVKRREEGARAADRDLMYARTMTDPTQRREFLQKKERALQNVQALDPGAKRDSQIFGGFKHRAEDVAQSIADRQQALQEQKRLQTEILQLRQEEHRTAVQQLRVIEQQRDAAQQMAEAARTKLTGQQASLGSMSQGQFDHLLHLKKKMQGGESLSEGEMRFMERTGGTIFGEEMHERRAQIGRQRLAAAGIEGMGEGVRGAETRAGWAAKEETAAALDQEVAAQREVTQDALTALKITTRANNQLMLEMYDELEKLRKWQIKLAKRMTSGLVHMDR